MIDLEGRRVVAPRPSVDLRRRVLDATRPALATMPPAPAHPSLIDRLWSNRRLRLAWLTTVLVLFGLNLALTDPMPGPLPIPLPASGAMTQSADGPSGGH